MSSKRKVVYTHTDAYPVYDVDEVKLGEECRCPKCNNNKLYNPFTEMIQHGLWEDVYFEFVACGDMKCHYHFIVRSTIPVEGDVPFDEFVKSLLDVDANSIPF